MVYGLKNAKTELFKKGILLKFHTKIRYDDLVFTASHYLLFIL